MLKIPIGSFELCYMGGRWVYRYRAGGINKSKNKIKNTVRE